ncbi:hypothetical protein C7M84_014799 [Penaeus vannamei]|uniref:Transmembrane protein n=1 Tax=Penaeus vannamei TaxID=6689 RepID=A0A3R7MQ10_PENVA|nr:hypothetical protein C7M84_014799 [Penaeus vannamei]
MGESLSLGALTRTLYLWRYLRRAPPLPMALLQCVGATSGEAVSELRTWPSIWPFLEHLPLPRRRERKIPKAPHPGARFSNALSPFRGGDVSFYFDSEKEMYWSFGCGTSDESSMWLIILFSGVAVCSFIMVIAICLLIYRRVSSSPPTHPETESPGFESIFIASPRCSQDDGESGTGRILAHRTPPVASDQAARGEVARQGGSGEGLQTADESRSRSKCPTPVNQLPGPTGTQSREEERRETNGNSTCSSWKSQEEGKVEVNGVENENREREQSRIPKRRDGHQNRKSKRRTAEQGPRTPSHAKKHMTPDGEDARTNTTPQVQEGPQSSRQKKIDRIPSEIIRQLTTNQSISRIDTSPSAPRNTLEKEPQGTRHRERAKQKKEISPRRGKSDTKALKPSCSGHALAKQENPLHREYGSGLIMHGTSTGNLAVGRANMGLQGPLPKGVFQQQGSIVVVARGRPGYVHQHPIYTGHCPPTGHRQNHRPVTTLPGNYRNRSRIHQPASDLEIRRVISHNGINETAHIAYAPPMLAPSQTLTIPRQHHTPSRTSPRLVPCYSPIVLSPGVRSAGHGLSATPSPRPRGGRRAQEQGGAEELYDQPTAVEVISAEMSNQGIRHRRWLLMLTVIGLGWVVATSVTVLGMFMTACRRRGKAETSNIGLCQSSSLHEGYAMVGFGSLMNVALLVTMLVLLMKDRRKNRVKPTRVALHHPQQRQFLRSRQPRWACPAPILRLRRRPSRNRSKKPKMFFQTISLCFSKRLSILFIDVII